MKNNDADVQEQQIHDVPAPNVLEKGEFVDVIMGIKGIAKCTLTWYESRRMGSLNVKSRNTAVITIS